MYVMVLAEEQKEAPGELWGIHLTTGLGTSTDMASTYTSSPCCFNTFLKIETMDMVDTRLIFLNKLVTPKG